VSITAENGFVLATSTFSQVPVPSTTRLVGTVLTLCLADKNVKIAGMKIQSIIYRSDSFWWNWLEWLAL